LDQQRIQTLLEEIDSYSVSSKAEVENFRLKFLGKKGALTELFGEMKNVPAEERKAFGQLVNELKNKAEEKLTVF